MNLKKILSNLTYPAITVAVIGLWILGAIHGKKKHNIDPFSSSFLVCWYYGIESTWHKTDYKELNDDVKVAVYLIASKPENIDAKALLEYNEAKKEFKEVISKLTKKELNYVKSGANAFVDYMASFQDDMVNSTVNFKHTRHWNLSQSSNTITLSKKCSSFGLEKEIEEMQKGIADLAKNLQGKYADENEPLDELIWNEKKIQEEMSQKQKRIKQILAEIFN